MSEQESEPGTRVLSSSQTLALLDLRAARRTVSHHEYPTKCAVCRARALNSVPAIVAPLRSRNPRLLFASLSLFRPFLIVTFCLLFITSRSGVWLASVGAHGL